MLDYIVSNAESNYSTNIITLFSALLGSIIGGAATLFAANQAYKNNLKIEARKEKEIEKAVALSIIEELKVLKEIYEKDMDELYKELSTEGYVESVYNVTQDFMTIYSNNASKLGMIKDEKLRNLIIKTYTKIKKYIEYLLIYNTTLTHFETCRNEFIARVYPKVLNSACSKVDNAMEINNIKKLLKQQNWGWLDTPYLNEPQIINFFHSDNEQIENLRKLSNDLKNKYFELKNLIDNTVDMASNLYKEQ